MANVTLTYVAPALRLRYAWDVRFLFSSFVGDHLVLRPD